MPEEAATIINAEQKFSRQDTCQRELSNERSEIRSLTWHVLATSNKHYHSQMGGLVNYSAEVR